MSVLRAWTDGSRGSRETIGPESGLDGVQASLDAHVQEIRQDLRVQRDITTDMDLRMAEGFSDLKADQAQLQAGIDKLRRDLFLALAQYPPNTPVELRPPAARTIGRPVIKNRRATRRVRQRVVELYQSGRSARYVAGEVGVSRTTVLNILTQSGVEPRPVGPVPRSLPVHP